MRLRPRISILLAAFVLSAPACTGGSKPAGSHGSPGSATCRGRPATVVGTPRNDVLHGTSGDDVIAGLGGNDVIFDVQGDNVICGDRKSTRLNSSHITTS